MGNRSTSLLHELKGKPSYEALACLLFLLMELCRDWPDYEKIMKLKNENSKSDTSRIDLVQLHGVLVKTSSQPLEECYQELYL